MQHQKPKPTETKSIGEIIEELQSEKAFYLKKAEEVQRTIDYFHSLKTPESLKPTWKERDKETRKRLMQH